MTHNASVGNETNDNIQEILKNYNRLDSQNEQNAQKTSNKNKN